MHTRRYPGLVVLLAARVLAAGVLACGPRPAQAGAVFRGLGDLPGGNFLSLACSVSADGAVVVGYGYGNSGCDVFRWTADTGMEALGIPYIDYADQPVAVSAQGNVVAGWGRWGGPTSEAAAYRWTLGGQIEVLGDLPGGPTYSRAIAVSGDGLTVAGHSSSASGTEAFRWTAETGMVGLGDLEGGQFYSVAWAVSADGAVVVGYGHRQPYGYREGREPFRWTADGGMVGLGYLRATDDWGGATDVSADGAVVVGWSGDETSAVPFRWTLAEGMQGLGALSGGMGNCYASAVSADGSVIVGHAATPFGGNVAFLWDSAHGMRDLRALLAEQCDLDGWTLTYAWDVSADGRTIVGWGRNPAGVNEGWVVTIPEPATLALVAAGGFLLLRQRGTPRRRS